MLDLPYSLTIRLFVGMRHLHHQKRDEPCLISMRRGFDYTATHGIFGLEKGKLIPTLEVTSFQFGVTSRNLIVKSFGDAFGEKAAKVFRQLESAGRLYTLNNTRDISGGAIWYLIFDKDHDLFESMVDMKKLGSFEFEDEGRISSYERHERSRNRFNAAKHRPQSNKFLVAGKPVRLSKALLKGAFTLKMPDEGMFHSDTLVSARRALDQTKKVIEALNRKRKRISYGSTAVMT